MNQNNHTPQRRSLSASMGFTLGNAFAGAPRESGISESPTHPGLNRTGYSLLSRSSNGPVLEEGGVIRSTADRSLAEARR